MRAPARWIAASFSELPGWDADRTSEVWSALRRSCERPAPGWAALCADAMRSTPTDDAQGCLQDGHWADGLIGYFPTYTLGDVFAAQLFARAGEELGDLDGAFARGEFAELVRWLGARIYRQGAQYFIEDLSSANGTFINGTLHLQPKTPHALHNGDVVKLGETMLKVSLA